MAPNDIALEWRLLSLVASGRDAEALELSKAERVDFNTLVLLAMRHRLVPTLSVWLTGNGLRRSLAYRIRSLLEDQRRLHDHRTRQLVLEAGRIHARLRAADVPHAFTKGVILQAEVYPEPGIRQLNDIDAMIDPAHREDVPRALAALGYATNLDYSVERREFVPLSRAEAIIYKVSPDHLPHLLRPGPDLAIPYISFDVAHSLTWFGAEWEVPLADALAGLRDVTIVNDGTAEVTVPAMGHPYSFLFTVLHLFREAWFQRTAETKDVNLSQFADVVRYWNAFGAEMADSLRNLVGKYGLADPVAWVLHHADALFETRMTDQLELLRHATPEWVSSGRGVNGRPIAWSGDMATRLVSGVVWSQGNGAPR